MPVLELAATQRQEHRPWPALLALTRVLALAATELELVVEREVADNPALEREEHEHACLVPCAWCNGATKARPRGEEARIRAPDTDELLTDARVGLSPREARLAEYVLGSLDHRGLLGCSTAELAHEAGAEEEELQRALVALRAAGPVWIGARDVREALLLQLDAMGEQAPSLARTLVEHHLGQLATGAFGSAARSLGVARAEVVEARDFIRAQLQPPSGAIRRPDPQAPMRSDVVIFERPGSGLDVDLPDARHLRVRIEPLWRDCATNAARPEAERRLATELVGRARAFSRRLDDRRRTVLEVARIAIERQSRYARGQGPPLPLTRSTVARVAGMHESTVSRAVAGKVVQLESGRVVPFASFFRASLGAEEALARVVAEEDRPLSDAELAGRLRVLGYPMARRTVTKYRARLGIVPHTVR